MMATITKREVLALARKRWPKAQLEENTKAPDAAERIALGERWQETKKRMDELAGAVRAAGDVNAELRKAARFAVDVDGDEPSWTELREATEVAERVAAALEERQVLTREMQANSDRRCKNRWRVVEVSSVGGIPMGHVRQWADTLEELAAKIEAASSPVS